MFVERPDTGGDQAAADDGPAATASAADSTGAAVTADGTATAEAAGVNGPGLSSASAETAGHGPSGPPTTPVRLPIGGYVYPTPGMARSAIWALGACALSGALAAVSVPRSWARATLSDRGSDLLVVDRSGWALRPTGQLVLVLGVLVVAICLAAYWSSRARPLVGLLPVAGIGLVVLAASRLHAADPMRRTISRLRIGTFQTDEPVARSLVGWGLWATLGAGVLLILASVSWLLLSRHSRRLAAGGGVTRRGVTYGGVTGPGDAGTRPGAGHGL